MSLSKGLRAMRTCTIMDCGSIVRHSLPRHSLLRHALPAALVGAVAAAVACGAGGIQRLGDDTAPDVDASGTVLGPDNQPAPTGPAGSGLATGLPCDVQALFENRCIGCHDGKTAGAPRLLDRADLTKASATDAKQSMAALSLARMKSTSSPMPPPPAELPDAEEIQIMADWVAAGTPKGVLCTDTPDGGSDASKGPADAGGGACASGVMWTNGSTKSPLMHPGVACNDCHQKSGGPNLRFAGTVYRAPHDVDDCNGAAPPLTVEITDKFNRKLTATVNVAGNFSIERPKGGGQQNQLSAPFRARIIDGAKTRAMVGSVTSGDCNACHTAAGTNLAPGRILAP